jgi:hypothetical protein
MSVGFEKGDMEGRGDGRGVLNADYFTSESVCQHD